jgi:hypothetical protein
MNLKLKTSQNHLHLLHTWTFFKQRCWRKTYNSIAWKTGCFPF